MTPITRREFTRTLAAVSTTAALSSFRVLGANDRVRLGFIGLGNRGDQVLDAFLKQPDAQVVAICDIYAPYLDFAAQKIGTSPKRYKATVLFGLISRILLYKSSTSFHRPSAAKGKINPNRASSE